jgi:hypothetical protein
MKLFDYNEKFAFSISCVLLLFEDFSSRVHRADLVLTWFSVCRLSFSCSLVKDLPAALFFPSKVFRSCASLWLSPVLFFFLPRSVFAKTLRFVFMHS